MRLLLGFPLDDFASTLEREACEARSLLNRLADVLVQDAAKDLKRHGLQEQGTGGDIDDREAIVVKSQNLIKQFNLLSGMKIFMKMNNERVFFADIRPVFVQVQERHSTSPICFNLSTSLYSSPIEIVGNVIALKLSADNPSMSHEDRTKIIREYRTRYWLQAFGCEERLFGHRPLIQSRVRSLSLFFQSP